MKETSQNNLQNKEINTNNQSFSRCNLPKGRFFSFYGICSLRKYWIHYLLTFFSLFITYLLVLFLVKILISINCLSFALKWTINGIFFLITIIFNFHIFCLGVQRFRSIGKNPWLFLIPIYGSVIVKIIPTKKDQSNNKYLCSKISLKKLYLLLSILITICNFFIGRVLPFKFLELAKTAKEIKQKTILSETKLHDSSDTYVFVEKKWFHYYLHIYDEDVTSIYTIIFKKKKTLDFLTTLKEKFENASKAKGSENNDEYEDFMNWIDIIDIIDFISFVEESLGDNIYIELFGPEGWTVRTFGPDQALVLLSDEQALNEKMEEYEVSKIRYYLFDFDEIVEQFLYYHTDDE